MRGEKITYDYRNSQRLQNTRAIMLKSTIGLIESLSLRFVSDATEFKQLWSLGFADIREVL